MIRKIILHLFVVVLVIKCSSVSGQQSNLRQRYISTKTDTIVLDSLSIIPQSFFITQENGFVDSTYFRLIDTQSKLIWLKRDSSLKDSVLITYRVFPILFSKTYQRRNRERIEKDFSGTYNPFTYVGDDSEGNLFKLDGLNKSGSISRGITVGNNQDAVLNSSLNLQLAGRISNNIDVLAAITDNNIPVQAEGNTQQLQEFDKVFIQLSNPNHKLIAGDFELKKPEGYFMSFYKKGQGALYSNISPVGKDKNKGVIKSTLSGAVSRGKFARNSFIGTEANQGPYRLAGAENEIYIVILSGSERVFIDGQLMERGQSGDYIIDYNTSELTFTSNRLITKDSRIVVEFQYSDKNYARTLFFGGTQWEQSKIKLRMNVYSEQDSKNQPLQQDLSQSQKVLLASVGDNIQLAVSPNVDSVAFNVTEILYAKRDTVVNGTNYNNIFVYSTNSDSAFYRLGFSFVGLNKGNYIQLSNSSANGRVYAWVAPVNGIPQGSYEPVVLLITPKKRQMLTLGGDYTSSNGLKVFTEVAGSKDDINLFSNLDKQNDDGYAALAGVQQSKNVFRSAKQPWKLTGSLRYEYTGKDFKAIETFRPVEFTRDWNLTGVTTTSDEHLATAGLSLEQTQKYFLSYHINTYQRGSIYNGIMHLGKINMKVSKFILNTDGSYLQTTGSINPSKYYRHTEDLSRSFGIVTLGMMYQQEHNAIQVAGADSLALNSFSFRSIKAYFKTSDTLRITLNGDYSRRYDDGIQKDNFAAASYADNINGNFIYAKNPNNRISGGATYRNLHISDSLLTAQPPDQSLIGRLEHNLTALKGAINLNTYYETGVGREQKKEYSYIEVAPGTGVYTWNASTDYNGDGIPQLNEFEVAQFQDQANYIRIFVLTNEYVKAYTNQLNIVLGLNPAAIYSTTGSKSLITHFATQSSLRFDNKLLGSNPVEALNPFPASINDSLLVTTNSSQRHTLYYNRTSNVFGADVTFQVQQNKQLLSYGFEFRKQHLYNGNLHWNLKQWLGLTSLIEYQRKESSSENFASRSYDIHQINGEQKIIFQPGSIYRITASYEYKQKKNFLGDAGELAVSNDAGLEFRLSSLKKGLISAKINLINIAYNQPENTPLAYEMLEGLKTGKNYTWNVSIQRNVTNSLQISLNYDGRKSENVKTIHTGGIQARAYF